MSEQKLDYATIRNNVEKRVYRQKWNYRLTFFVMHLLFFVVAMVAIWGTLAANAPVRDILFNSEFGAAIVVVVPTILWAAVLLFHVASLYIETSAAEKAMRERLLMREVGEDILRRGLMDDGMLEKPKRRASVSEAERMLSSYDGELMAVYDDEQMEQTKYDAPAQRSGDMS